jgi:hypothetical protein
VYGGCRLAAARNLDSFLLETTDIHVSDRWIQTDLDDPELKNA